MLSLLAAILVFGIIILFHEFGHFLFAKLGGICVLEFSLGMGPRLLSFKRAIPDIRRNCCPLAAPARCWGG